MISRGYKFTVVARTTRYHCSRPRPSHLYLLDRLHTMSEQKALLLESKHGSFVVTSIPKPTTASAGELIVKVQAAGLNPVDWKIQSYGLFYEDYPVITGSDVAGDVEQVGEGVVGFKKGDRV